jgi:hypothetical protein
MANFGDFQEAMDWLDEQIAERIEYTIADDYRVVSALQSHKIYEVPGYKTMPSHKSMRAAFELAEKAILDSMKGMLAVWSWDYDDYEKDAKEDDREPSEDDYAELLQIYTDDFIDDGFDEDLKLAMEDAREFEWREEYDFKRKMNQYLKDLSAFEEAYKEVERDEHQALIREVFDDE